MRTTNYEIMSVERQYHFHSGVKKRGGKAKLILMGETGGRSTRISDMCSPTRKAELGVGPIDRGPKKKKEKETVEERAPQGTHLRGSV